MVTTAVNGHATPTTLQKPKETKSNPRVLLPAAVFRRQWCYSGGWRRGGAISSGGDDLRVMEFHGFSFLQVPKPCRTPAVSSSKTLGGALFIHGGAAAENGSNSWLRCNMQLGLPLFFYGDGGTTAKEWQQPSCSSGGAPFLELSPSLRNSYLQSRSLSLSSVLSLFLRLTPAAAAMADFKLAGAVLPSISFFVNGCVCVSGVHCSDRVLGWSSVV
ncbi:hypothetical protein PIB30_076669 [Stylosanthes scabra]|uniref:Uncharacterized protein n=1 Tax=Stylosanthes scabra TaxID=79078 RepID=A0ABU6VRC6_9FABA|nr:hypothetical protein [Stylosanthes scabra]